MVVRAPFRRVRANTKALPSRGLKAEREANSPPLFAIALRVPLHGTTRTRLSTFLHAQDFEYFFYKRVKRSIRTALCPISVPGGSVTSYIKICDKNTID